ncbi:MAG: bifunctional DNA-formamidopyrimidine glycosylase/DNA-(apurinic or apyrimidinic site) lyase [Deltaproteobacteria bacterium]|jgi:formamidopyrimidine-DNA glycosylase|nr:bifunctional DNA-formamidopyrimidine glycosylase/DNA-(apurinic or apyrimidinic site) lyase [Deltaproteobacteria bacterium]
MPELPEVQTIINELSPIIIGKNLVKIEEFRENTLINQQKISYLGQINTIFRRGKYIIITTDQKLQIIIHLRMTGKLIYTENLTSSSSHMRAHLIFSDHSKLIFDDVRTFGQITIAPLNQQIKSLDILGAEPFSNDFSTEYLWQKFRKRKAPIKNILLNQTIIAGLGNIYVNEILFACQIHPAVPTNSLNKKQIGAIISNTIKILKKAIKYNGTTISDYKRVDNKSGKFQNFLKIYQKTECPKCGNPVSRIKQAGRSTFFCYSCQNNPHKPLKSKNNG